MKALLLLFMLVPVFSFASVSVQSDTAAPRSSFTYTYHWWRGYRFFENGEKITNRAAGRLLWKDPESRPYMKRQLIWICIGLGASLAYVAGAIIIRRNHLRIPVRSWQWLGFVGGTGIFLNYINFKLIPGNFKKAVRARAQ